MTDITHEQAREAVDYLYDRFSIMLMSDLSPMRVDALCAYIAQCEKREAEAEKHLEACCDEAHHEGFDEGQDEANGASADLWKAMCAHLRHVGVMPEYGEMGDANSFTAQDLMGALADHEANLRGGAALLDKLRTDGGGNG